VLAVAVYGKCDVIATENTKCFPPESTPYRSRVLTTDEFLCNLYHLGSIEFIKAIRGMLEGHCKLPKTVEDLLDTNSFSKQAPNCKRLIMPHLGLP